MKMQKPWLIIGDFNEVRDPCEKKGEAPFNWKKANLFNENIHIRCLMDVDM